MKKLYLISALLLLLLGSVHIVSAQSGGGYDLLWNTIDNGGAIFATGGGYELAGSIGQPDAGQVANLPYTLSGGFWFGGRIPTPPDYNLFLPLVVRNH